MSSDSDDPILLHSRPRTKPIINGQSAELAEPPSKRRRLSSDDVVLVESSDVGEMEELAAEDDDYWRSPPTTERLQQPAARIVGRSAMELAKNGEEDLGERSQRSARSLEADVPGPSMTLLGDRRSSMRPTRSPQILPTTSPLETGTTHFGKPLLRPSSPASSPLSPAPSAGSSSSVFQRLNGGPTVPGPSRPTQYVLDMPPDSEPVGRVRELRPRTKKQLAPFTMDRAEYERQLRGAREAIVRDKIRSTGREESQYEEEQGTGESLDVEGGSDNDTFVPPPSPPIVVRRQEVPGQRSRSPENGPPRKKQRHGAPETQAAPSMNDVEIFARFGGVISDEEEPSFILPKIPKKKALKPTQKVAPLPMRLGSSPPDRPSPRHTRRSSSTLRPSNSPARSDVEDPEPRISADRFTSSTSSPAMTGNYPHTQDWPNGADDRSPPMGSASITGSESDESDNDSSASIYLQDKDYKKMKALSHMVPWFMVKQGLQGGRSPKGKKAARARSPTEDRTPTPEPLPPGSHGDLDDWIHNDEDHSLPRNNGGTSQHRRDARTPTIIELSDDDQDDESSSADGDVQFVSAARRSPGPRMERDLIDRMLSRPTYVRKGPKRKRESRKRRVVGRSDGHQAKLRFPVVGYTRHRDDDFASSKRQYSQDEAPRRHRRRHFGGSLEDDDLIFRKPVPHRMGQPTARPLTRMRSPAEPQPPDASRHFHRTHSTNHVILPGPLPDAHPQVPTQERVPQPSDWDLYATFSLDFGIQPLAPGVKLSPSSYIGKGRLYELLGVISSTTANEVHPRDFSGMGLELDASLNSAADLEAKLPAICDALYDWAIKASTPDTDSKAKDLMRYVTLMVTKLIPRQTTENSEQLCDEVDKQLQHLLHRFPLAEPDGVGNPLSRMSLHFFVLEVCTRSSSALRTMGSGETAQIRRLTETMNVLAKDMISQLLQYGIHQTMRAVKRLHTAEGDTLDDLTVELWICVMHLSKAMSVRYPTMPSFSLRLESALVSKYPEGLLTVYACEQIWYTTMAICALSQFTPSGISISQPHQDTYWPFVIKALSHIQLIASPSADQMLSNVAATNRDRHIRVILKRCCTMVTRWSWSLAEAEGLLKVFNDLFKSRKFSNLDLEKRPDFATFLSALDIRLLSDLDGDDTAYGMFLKLLAGAADSMRAQGNERRVTKLLGAIIPVGVVTFTKESPPTRFELSQLYNRYSAILLAIYLEPSSSPRRIDSARRILEFVKADNNSRQVCLRAVMYLGVLLRHLGLDLRPAAQWTSDMMDILLADFSGVISQDGAAGLAKDAQFSRDEAEMMVCMLLRSMAKVVEIASLDLSSGERSSYPDTALLQNSWSLKILRSASYLKTAIPSEALRYIQAFLNQRLRAAPAGKVPTAPRIRDEESQDFGDADYDYEDPAFLQLLQSVEGGMGADPKAESLGEKDLAQLIDKDLSPAVFQLISNIFADGHVLTQDQWAMVDAAVDCWSSCAQVLVFNGIREWSSYFSLYGVESYHRLMNKADRRRVGLRIMYKALLLDPRSYGTCQEDFLAMWCQTIIRPKITLEHLYTRALLQCPEARRGLLSPLCSEEHRQTVEGMDAAGLEICRLELLESVFANARQLLAEDADDAATMKERNMVSSVIREIVPAMKDYYWIYMSTGLVDGTGVYHQFCRKILDSLNANLPHLVVNGDLTWLPPQQPTDIHTVHIASIIH